MPRRPPVPVHLFPLRALVEVTWEDSFTEGKWRSIENYREDADSGLWCRSVGYVLASNARIVQLIQSQCANRTVSDSIIIPRACVRRVRRLR